MAIGQNGTSSPQGFFQKAENWFINYLSKKAHPDDGLTKSEPIILPLFPNSEKTAPTNFRAVREGLLHLCSFEHTSNYHYLHHCTFVRTTNNSPLTPAQNRECLKTKAFVGKWSPLAKKAGAGRGLRFFTPLKQNPDRQGGNTGAVFGLIISIFLFRIARTTADERIEILRPLHRELFSPHKTVRHTQ